MSITFAPLTTFENEGAMSAQVRFDVVAGGAAFNAGAMVGNVAFGFTGATSRTASRPESVSMMFGDVDFPFEGTGGYTRYETVPTESDIVFGAFALSAAVGGYMDRTLGFAVEAVGPEPSFTFVGDAAIRVVAYGAVGFPSESVQEQFTLAQATRVDLSILVDQPLILRASAAHTMESERALADEIRFGEAIQLTYRLLIAEGLLFADTPQEQYEAVARVLDSLLLGGIAATEADAVSVVTAAVLFGLQTDAVLLEKLADGVRLGDSFEASLQLATDIVESLLFGNVSFGTAVVATRVEDRVLGGAPVATAAQAANAIREALAVGIRFSLDDGDYVAWALNTGSKHLSKYEQYPVNSFAVLDGKLYGALDDGIYLLEGADDDGDNINARVRFALTDMGTGLQKRVSTAYFGYTAENDLLLKVIHTKEGGAKEAYVYRLNAAPATEAVNGRAVLGKGVTSAYFAFELENVDGGMFNVDKLSVIPMTLDRRVKRS